MDEQGERPTQGSTFGQTKVLFPRGRVSKQDSPFRTRSSCLAPPARAPRVPILDVYHHDIMYLICQHPELDSNRHQKQYADAPPAASVALSVRLAGVPRAVALHLPHGAAAARHGAHARGVATQRNRRAAREALAVVPLRRRCVPPPSRARAASLSPRSSRATAPRRSVTACTARAVPDDARAGSPCVEPHAPVTRAHGWPVHGAAPLRHCAPAFGDMPIRLRCRCGREGIR